MMSSELNERVDALRRRIFAIGYLAELSRVAGVVLVLLGSLGLVWRQVAKPSLDTVGLLYLALLGVPFITWLRVRRGGLTRVSAATWLDLRSGSSGLLVTLAELHDERWMARAAALLAAVPALPRPDWRRFALRTLPAGLFAMTPFLAASLGLEPAPPPSYDAAVERLREKLATLEEVVVLQDDERRGLHDDLARLADDLSGARPEAAFEAIDRLEERLDSRGEQAREAGAKADRSLARAADASADPARSAQPSADAWRDALQDLREAGLLDEQRLRDALDPDIPGLDPTDAGALASLDPDSQLQLSQELRELLHRQMAELAKAGLSKSGGDGDAAAIDAGALARLLEGEPLPLHVTSLPPCEDAECDHGSG